MEPNSPRTHDPRVGGLEDRIVKLEETVKKLEGLLERQDQRITNTACHGHRDPRYMA